MNLRYKHVVAIFLMRRHNPLLKEKTGRASAEGRCIDRIERYEAVGERIVIGNPWFLIQYQDDTRTTWRWMLPGSKGKENEVAEGDEPMIPLIIAVAIVDWICAMDSFDRGIRTATDLQARASPLVNHNFGVNLKSMVRDRRIDLEACRRVAIKILVEKSDDGFRGTRKL